MPNEVIIIIALVALVVVGARKWDTLKWWIGLGLVALAIYTAATMGMFDSMIGDAKEKLPTVSVG